MVTFQTQDSSMTELKSPEFIIRLNRIQSGGDRFTTEQQLNEKARPFSYLNVRALIYLFGEISLANRYLRTLGETSSDVLAA